MIAAGIRELKTHLSRYLRQVAGGETILVTDRGRVIAEVRPPGAADREGGAGDARYRLLVAAGAVRPASNPKERPWAGWAGLGLPGGTADAWLEADRGE
jgi:antitoxin (DNA-binding transcriptional repressor) of toxin-antitoxin stability system